MARPKLEMPDVQSLLPLIDGEGRLSVRVTPGARSEAVVIDGGRLQVKVRAKPEDGEANAAVRALIAKALNLAPSSITLLRGATSREKQFRVDV